MLIVELETADFDGAGIGFIKIGRLNKAIAKAKNPNIPAAELLAIERKLFAGINAAVQLGKLKPLDPSTLAPLSKSDYGNGIVPLAEVVEWGRDTNLFDFKIAAVQVSKAPPPIMPIRGNGYIPKQSESDRLPRWNKWRLMPEVKEWEAVALSLNIEPGKVKTNRDAWMGAAHPFDEGEEFNDRLEILKKHAYDRTHFPTPCSINMGKWYLCEVRLDEFAAWCIYVGFEIPPELAALAKAATQAAPMVEAAPAAKVEALPVKTPAPVTQGSKLRRNSLDPAIDEAIKQAGSDELAAVYLKLKAMALDEVMPFTGALDGDALCYTDDENNPAKLTKDALGKRLKRR